MTDDIGRGRLSTWLVFFVNGFGVASWLTRIPAVRDQTGLDDRGLGLTLLCWALGSFIAFRLVGRWVERYGSGRVTRLASVLYVVVMPLPAIATSAPMLAAALIIVGIANGTVDVAMNAQGVEIETRLARPILSSFHAAFSLGGLSGAGVGALAIHARLSPPVHLAWVAGLLLLCIAKLTFIADAAAPARGARWQLPPARLIVFGIIAFCSSVGEGAMGDWSALFVRDVAHASETIAALGYASFSLAMTVGRLVGDRLIARFGGTTLLLGGGIVAGLGLAMAIALVHPAVALMGFACVGAGLSVVVPIVFSASGQVEGISPGAALAVVATLSYGGFLSGPPLIGILAHAIGLRFALVVVVVLAFVLATLAPITRREATPPASA